MRIDDETYRVVGVAPRVLEAFDARMKFVVPLSWPQAAENPQGRYGAFVLLIGCFNVANLLLVRSNARQSELAIRSALGAGRAAIARQFVLESMLLTSLGEALGLGVAWGALRITNFYLARMLPQSLPASLDWRVLGFAVAPAVVVGLLIGIIPVLHLLRTNLAAVIQSSSRGASSSRGVRALSGVLVVAQVGVALMLLTGAGLLIHSFAQALRVDTDSSRRPS